MFNEHSVSRPCNHFLTTTQSFHAQGSSGFMEFSAPTALNNLQRQSGLSSPLSTQALSLVVSLSALRYAGGVWMQIQVFKSLLQGASWPSTGGGWISHEKMFLAKLPWVSGRSLVWAGEIMEPEKDLRLLHSPWASTNISREDAATLAGRLGKGYWEVSSGEPPENTCVTGAQDIRGASQVVKDPPANTGDAGSVPGLGRSPGEENGNPLQYSCLGNPMK